MGDGARVGEDRLHFPLAGLLAHLLGALADAQTEIRDALRHSSSPRSRSRGRRVESAPPSRLGSDWVGYARCQPTGNSGARGSACKKQGRKKAVTKGHPGQPHSPSAPLTSFRPLLDHHDGRQPRGRSEEHTSELQSLMRISYAVFCLKKKKHQQKHYTYINTQHI